MLRIAFLAALAMQATNAKEISAGPTPIGQVAEGAKADDAQPLAPTPDATRLSIEEALTLAEKYSPMLSGAAAQVTGARAGIQTATAYPNPYFYFMMGPQFARPIATPGVPGLLQRYAVSQPLELPALRRTRIEVARLARDSSQFGVAATRLAVRADVQHSFYDVLRRREEIEHAEENLRLLEDLRRRTGVQVDVGEAPKLELTRAEAEIAGAQNAVKAARLLYVAAISALRAAVSAPLGENITAEGSLSQSVTLPPLQTLRTEMLANHPVLAQANADLERSRVQVANEKAQRIPQPSIEAEFENQPDLRYYRLGVSFPLPVLNRRQGQIAEAAAAVTRAEATVRQRRLELAAALESAYGQYLVADQQVKSFEAGALRQASAAVQAAEAAYRFGARGIIEVLDAQRVLQRVRGDLLDAQFERQNALINLQELGAVK